MSELKLISHVMGESFVFARVEGEGVVYAGFTDTDGLYYSGAGENAQRAFLDCLEHIKNYQPGLRKTERMIKVDPRNRRIYEADITAGTIYFDRITGRSEVPTHLMPNDYLVLRLSDSRPLRKWELSPLPPTPVPTESAFGYYWKANRRPQQLPEPCPHCGGNPAECRPRQFDVDIFECDNSLRSKGVR